MVLGNIIRLGQARLAGNILRHLPLSVEERVIVSQQILHKPAVFPLDLAELSAVQLGVRGLVDEQRTDLDAHPVGSVFNHKRAVDIIMAEINGADIAVPPQGQGSVRHKEVDHVHRPAVHLDRAAASRSDDTNALHQLDRVAVGKVVVLQFFNIANRAVFVGDLACIQLAAEVAVALRFVDFAVLAGNDLNVGNVCVGRHCKAVGHKAVRARFQYALVILESITCLQQIGDHYGISAARKADTSKTAAGKLDVLQALGIGKGNAQRFKVTAFNRNLRFFTRDPELSRVADVSRHRHIAARRLYSEIFAEVAV